MSWLSEAARWYGVLALMTWGLAPLVARLGSGLPTRGAFVARPLALLAVVYPSWLLASLDLVPYGEAGLWATLALAALGGWGLAWQRGWITREWLRSLAVAEVVTLVAFAAFIGLRGYTPQIAGTEKPMDLAFLAASARATEVPPADPWYAGEAINYYYLGYFLHGTLARLSEVPVWVAYNLALAATFAITVAAAGGLAFDAVRPWLGRRAGLVAAGLGAFFLAIAGNLHAPLELLREPRGTIDAWWWGGIGWESSRVVVDRGSPLEQTINEFPYFSFLLGDLHPHVTALPFTLVALALALNLGAGRRRVDGGGETRDRGRREGGRPEASGEPDESVAAGGPPSAVQHPPSTLHRPASGVPPDWPILVVTGAVIGALYPLNSWDLPTYLVVALAAIVAGSGWTRAAIGRAGVLVGAAVLAWLPFSVRFVPFAGGDAAGLPAPLRELPGVSRLLTTAALYDGERTGVGEFLTVFGVAWVAAVAFLAVHVIQVARSEPGAASGVPDGADEEAGGSEGAATQRRRVPGIAAATGVIAAIAAVVLPAPVILLAGGPLVAALWLLTRPGERGVSAARVATGCFAAGFGLVLFTEFFYIEDVFQGRYNTLFKVYYQAWTLFAIGGAVAIVWLWRAGAGNALARATVGAGTVAAIAAGLVYPVVASEQWTEVNGPREWAGLDGAAYLGEMAPDDLAAIRWLAEKAEEGDVVLEAPGCSYWVNGGVPTNRLSAFTGVPTVIGWNGHEDQWRGGQAELRARIGPRAEDVAAMYADPRSPLFDEYGVTLLFVGSFERQGAGERCEQAGPFPAVNAPGYPGAGWTEVFASGDARIYRRAAAER